MTDETDRGALAGIIRAVTDLWDEPLNAVHDVPQILNAILASDWLAADRAATRRQALDEAVEAIQHRRNEHWQNRIVVGPEGRTEPKDYGKHDAYHDAARVVANLRDGGEE